MFLVTGSVAISAKSKEIFRRIVTEMAAVLDVMNMQIRRSAAGLAFPAIAF